MPSPDPKAPGDVDPRELRRLTRRGFAWAAGFVAAGAGGLAWLNTRGAVDGLSWPLRAILHANERFWGSLPGRAGPAREFPPSMAREPRPNGDIGLDGAVDPASWRLQVAGPVGEARSLTMADIRRLPRVESTNELKCVEGWSEVVGWSGFRLADLAAMTGLATRSGRPFDPAARPGDILPYVALETPDEGYYVGLDSAAAFHPQTLLCDAMNGAPLTPEHGAPLRLAIPVKYGIKNIKRIGTIRFTADRPRDYWAEQGYDWYAGL